MDLIEELDEDTELEKAVIAGDLETVKKLLDDGNAIPANSGALHIACYYGHIDIVKLLIDEVCINALDGALREAGSEGHLEIVKLLLHRGANIHAGNDGVLYFAGMNGHLEVVKFLLDEGADMKAKNCIDIAFNGDVLCGASFNGHWHVVDELLGRGFDMHASSDHALWYAGFYNNMEAAVGLLKRGAKMSSNEPRNEKLIKIARCYTTWKRWRRHLIKQWARRLIVVWYRSDMPGGMKDKRILSQF